MFDGWLGQRVPWLACDKSRLNGIKPKLCLQLEYNANRQHTTDDGSSAAAQRCHRAAFNWTTMPRGSTQQNTAMARRLSEAGTIQSRAMNLASMGPCCAAFNRITTPIGSTQQNHYSAAFNWTTTPIGSTQQNIAVAQRLNEAGATQSRAMRLALMGP